MSDRCAPYREQLVQPKVPVYATIIPSRTTKGVVAMHMQLGHAKNAVTTQTCGPYDRSRGGYAVDEAEVYELVDGAWRLLWRIERGTYKDDLPWRK